MASPRLEHAARSTRSESDVREARRVKFEKDRADFNRRLDAERNARQRAAVNGDDY